MSFGFLKLIRIIVPGFLLFLSYAVFIASEQGDFGEIFTQLNIEDLIYSVPVIIFGVLYYAMDIRSLLWKIYLKRINDNIKIRLTDPFMSIYNDNRLVNLKKGDLLMSVFYHFIDNDESLTIKSKNVYFNGSILTSFIDLTLIALFNAIVSIIIFLIMGTKNNLLLFIIFIIIGIFSYLLSRLLLLKHLKLSDEQLEIIVSQNRQSLKDKIDEIID